ncbi:MULTISPECIES: hypothetical protein [Streptomyces]|uniref:hypothetical protein n=1 Tax=Streptomyces TaxID=1883 RepID=UPI00163CAC09|nr:MULTISPECIES: hypothetical protein [Streptomyces]MBC2878025.1 hypothetical protein [Streptomyces sp. TYQ1024]UBI39979.1 hypothetical protein K7I03_28265 [Streptomyces mobaraensis]UKW32559.1 hypothetical protein MCU78_28195 [Streptomyces sp. TYQ1024]
MSATTGDEAATRRLSEIAAFYLRGLPKDARENAVRERAAEELERAVTDIRKALTSERW